jgi:hypothetical protein
MMNSMYPAFVWWQGVIENRSDPDKLGRYKVRIFGYHTRDKAVLPTSDLPWAIPMQPVTSAAISGVGTSPTGLVEGSTVIGFFADGNDAQIPIIMGSWGCMSVLPEDGNGNVIEFDRTSTGFYDPRSAEEADAIHGSYPRQDNTETGTGKNRLKEPDSSRLARGGAAVQTHYTYVGKDASRVKADGEYKGIPLAVAPEMTIYDLPEVSVDHPGQPATKAPVYTETYWEEPVPGGANSKYPFNHVTETESGHVFERDDTPGAERIHNYHTSGTYDEVNASGTKSVKIVGDNYEIILKDKNLFIKGDFNVTVEGDYKLNVLGNKYEDIMGHSFTSIRGNRITKVQGNSVTEILTDESTVTVGNKWETIQSNKGLGTYTQRITGDFIKAVGGRETATHMKSKTAAVMGDYTITTSPTLAMEIKGTAVVPKVSYGSFKLLTTGDISIGTATLPAALSPTFPTVSIQSSYISTSAKFGHTEVVGISSAPLTTSGQLMGKWTQVDYGGITELVTLGNRLTTIVAGNKADIVSGLTSNTSGAGFTVVSTGVATITATTTATITGATTLDLNGGSILLN